MTFEHENAKRTWISTEEDEKGYTKTVLNIKTDLVINPNDPDHDAEAMLNFQNEIEEYQRQHDDINKTDVTEMKTQAENPPKTPQAGQNFGYTDANKV